MPQSFITPANTAARFSTLTARVLWPAALAGAMVLAHPSAMAQSGTSTTVSRCESSFSEQSLSATVDTCRNELTVPITRQRRLSVLETLGKAYLAQNEPRLALNTWNEAAQYITPGKADPVGSEQWARLQVLMAQTLVQLEQPKEAQNLLDSTIRRIERDNGRFSMPAGVLQDALGTFYALQNQPEKALAAFQRSRIIHEIRLGRVHPRTIETRMNQAVGLLDMNKEADAKAGFMALAEIVGTTDNLKRESVSAEVLTFLGTLQMRDDELKNAAVNYQTAFEIRQAVFGPNDIRTSQSLNNLGVVLYRAGDLQRAEKALSRAYVIRKDALGDKDSLTLSTQKNLQAVIAAQQSSKIPDNPASTLPKTIQKSTPNR